MSQVVISKKTHKIEHRILLLNFIYLIAYTLILPFIIYFVSRSNPTLGKLFGTMITTIVLHILILFGMGFLYEVKRDTQHRVGHLQSAGILAMIAPGSCLLAMVIYKMLGGGAG